MGVSEGEGEKDRGALTAGWLPRKAEYLKRNRNLENALDCYQGVRRISRISAEILSRVDEEGARRRREENYHALYQHICGMKRLWAILPEKETHAPLYLPVYVKERDSLQRFLAGYGIYAPVLWPVGEENKDFLQGDGTYIFEHMLALPIDQRYDAGDMEQLAEVLALYEKQPVIGIRVDVNETVATGHIMRCITIAEQIKNWADKYCLSRLTGRRRSCWHVQGWSMSACSRGGITWRRNCRYCGRF